MSAESPHAAPSYEQKAPAIVRAYSSGFMRSLAALHKECIKVEDTRSMLMKTARDCSCSEPSHSPTKCFSWRSRSVNLSRTICRESPTCNRKPRTRQSKSAASLGASAAFAAIQQRPNTSNFLRPSVTTPVMLLEYDATINPAERNQIWSSDRRDPESLGPCLDLALKNNHTGAQFFNKSSGGFVAQRYETLAQPKTITMSKSSLALGRALSRSGLLDSFSELDSGSVRIEKRHQSSDTLRNTAARLNQTLRSASMRNGVSPGSIVSAARESFQNERDKLKESLATSSLLRSENRTTNNTTKIESGSLGMICSDVKTEPMTGSIFIMNGLPYRKRLSKSRLGFRSWRGRAGENEEHDNWQKSFVEETDYEKKRHAFSSRKSRTRSHGQRTLPAPRHRRTKNNVALLIMKRVES